MKKYSIQYLKAWLDMFNTHILYRCYYKTVGQEDTDGDQSISAVSFDSNVDTLDVQEYDVLESDASVLMGGTVDGYMLGDD